MAASRLPAPGTDLGPCLPSCKHTDCAATRMMAADRCTYCKQEIGYDRRFYEIPPSVLVHASCHEAAILAKLEELIG